MTEHGHPDIEETLARIERKLDQLIERDLARMQFDRLREQLDELERRDARQRTDR